VPDGLYKYVLTGVCAIFSAFIATVTTMLTISCRYMTKAECKIHREHATSDFRVLCRKLDELKKMHAEQTDLTIAILLELDLPSDIKQQIFSSRHWSGSMQEVLRGRYGSSGGSE